MNIFNKAINSFIWHLVGAAILFIFQFQAAKYLGADFFGEANYLLGYSSVIMLFGYFGVQTYIPKKMQLVKDKDKFIGNILSTMSCIYFLFVPVLMVILLINNITVTNSIYILVISYALLLIEIITSYYIGLNNQKRAAFIRRFLFSLLNLLIFYVLIIVVKKSSQVYILSTILATFIIIIPFCFKRIKYFSFNASFIKETFPYYVSQVGYSIYLASAKVIQGNFGSFSSVGILSVAISFGGIANMFGENFSKVSMPELANAWKEKNLYKIKKIYEECSRLNTFLVLPIAIILVVNSERILDMLGKGYSGGELIMRLILISQLFNSFLGPNGPALSMTGYQKLEVYNGYIKSAVGLVTGVLLGRYFEWGIAFSIAFSEIIVNIIKMIQIKMKLKFWPYDKRTLGYIFTLAIIELVAAIGIYRIKNIFLWIFLNCIFVLASYIISFIFSVNKSDKEIIVKLINIFKKRC